MPTRPLPRPSRGLLAALLLAPGVALSASAIGDLDVTIRMIERQAPDAEAVINRIEPPRVRPPAAAERGAQNDQADGGDRTRRGDAVPPGREAGREHDRDRHWRGDGEDRRRHAPDEARDRSREARENSWQRREERRDDRPSRGDRGDWGDRRD